MMRSSLLKDGGRPSKHVETCQWKQHLSFILLGSFRIFALKQKCRAKEGQCNCKIRLPVRICISFYGEKLQKQAQTNPWVFITPLRRSRTPRALVEKVIPQESPYPWSILCGGFPNLGALQ